VTGPRESADGAGTLYRAGKLRPADALASAGVRPHKSKGQNFLVQPRVADRIVEAAEIARGDDVIEIGPGLGILSERIAERPLRRLILIELDERLALRLRERFAGDLRITVINRDFLAVPAPDIFAIASRDIFAFAGQDLFEVAPRDCVNTPRSAVPDACEMVHDAPVRVVANLPFNVAAAILERLCTMQARIARMVLMFQREVAERIRARPGAGNYGALSVYTAMYWGITGHFRVAAGSFHPKPKVDAEVLTFAPRRPLPFAPEEEIAVLATVRAAFSAPRKTLRNAVGKALAIDSAMLEAAFERAALDPAARAATLAAGDFVRLARALELNSENRNDRDA
jgi:16S rRNA (adenine1518-N6/adenine1519-N6)-dimethyltransferase